jgi:hypothetical protein
MIDGLFSSAFDDFPIVDDALVRFVEERLGKTLPSSYLNLIRQQNGGYLLRNAFPTSVRNYSADGYIPVDYIAGLSRDEDSVNGVLVTRYMVAEWYLPSELVLLCGDGHTWVAFDYRDGRTEPAVTYLDIEMNQEVRLADTFESFVAGLVDPALDLPALRAAG